MYLNLIFYSIGNIVNIIFKALNLIVFWQKNKFLETLVNTWENFGSPPCRQEGNPAMRYTVETVVQHTLNIQGVPP